MEWADIAKILFGAALGFAISIGQSWLTNFRDARRAKKLLMLELPEVQSAIDGLSGKKMMPTTELPMLDAIGTSEMLALPTLLAAQVRQMQHTLTRAEISRKIASEAINNQGSPEFAVHSTIYASCMQSAKERLDEIQKQL